MLKAAKQRTQRFASLTNALGPQRPPQLLQLFGQQRGAAQLQHHQATAHLVQVVDKSGQGVFIPALGGKLFQCQARLGQAVTDGALDPGEGYRVMQLSHICSRCHAHWRALNVAASVAG
ncbi:hypothetical protein D3C80_1072040 [compost metagenome]